MTRTPTLLVTDAARGSALAFVRSLGARGWRVVAADELAGAAGGRSRFAHAAWTYPAPATRAHAYVESIREAVRIHEVDFVLPVTDAAAEPLVHARERIAARLVLPDEEARALVRDKERTLALARANGVPIPATRAVATVEEAREAATSLAFPVVVKPAVSSRYLPGEGRVESFKVAYARDFAELVRRVGELEGRTRVLLQGFVAGTGTGVELLADRGRVVAAFQHRRLAEVPVTGGASAWRESVALDPELFELSRRMVTALGWTGLLMVEFKGDGRPRLMEINGRVWGSLPLAVRAGVDFPARLGELLLGSGEPPAEPEADYALGLRAYDPGRMAIWILATLLGRGRRAPVPAPPRRAALGGILALFDPRQRSDFYEPGDARPALTDVARTLRRLLAKVRRPTRPEPTRVSSRVLSTERG